MDNIIVPGELLRMVADELSGSSEVNASYVADDYGREFLVLAGLPAAASSTFTVSDNGTSVRWDYDPLEPGRLPPRRAADIITALLTGEDGPYPRLGDAYDRPGMTYTAAVGRELSKRGLHVTLNPALDDLFYMVHAAIDITGPDPAASAVLGDEGFLSWEKECLDSWPGSSPAAIARDLTASFLRAARP